MSVSAGGAFRGELPVCCEDTRFILTVIGKPLAGLISVAIFCTLIDISDDTSRYN